MSLIALLAMMADAPLPSARLEATRQFDLGRVDRRHRRHRLSALPPIEDDAEPRSNPLSVLAMEDERQRLRLGVKPGGISRARVGLDYRLALGR